ncbi:sensor histidine kinase [Paenibacillus albiflavus]|uniref:Sensor histidine kinase n=1 Tax=Paenibacillus albiflavus TaxID=2545760 RepID=A0A4R4EIG2_9BACL|nr:sensor histidine kinase [Paenibacillus albiflavus]TCZ79936.1 sensor histidine kinase [Paenibacillus albiflavus]
MTLRRKFMLAIILLVFIPIIALGVFSYVNFAAAMERKTSEFYYTSLLETDRKLNYALAEINGISDVSIVQPLVQQFLKRHLQQSQLSINSGTNEDRQLTADLNNLLLAHPKINSLSLYSKHELLYYSNPEARITLDVLLKSPWYPRMTKLLGRPLWLGPYENPNLTDNPMQLTHSRTIKDYYTLEDIGTLVLTVKTDMLDTIFWEASTLNQGDILLLNDEGRVLFSKSGQNLGKQMQFPFLSSSAYHPAQSYRDKYNGLDTFITYVPSALEGWHLVALTPVDEVMKDSRSIRNITLGLLLISLLMVFLFDRMFVARLVKMIGTVVRGMKRVEIGQFNANEFESPYDHVKDEAGALLHGFKRMSSQIGELITRVEEEQKRKKQAEMQALMSQINPHFIYNSLESINSMAVLQGNREISRMVISLGKLLRISISENQELIPLAMEIEHVKNYLLIQKFRFEDKIDFELDVQDSLKNIACMRLIVQPIVENALYHGIEQMNGKGLIQIRAFEYRQDLIIEIADNGLGMSSERFEEVFLETFSEAAKHKRKGVGMRNVHERIRIRFGEPYGLMVCSSMNEGTIVRIRIPIFISDYTYSQNGDKGADNHR